MNDLNTPDDDRLKATLIILKNHFFDPKFTVKKWAKALNMSVPYLSKFLRERTGKPPSVHLRDARLQHAQGLLKEMNKTIIEIALASGYEDNNYFSRVFKQNFTLSPSEWRLLHQKG